jgi:transposase
MKITTVGLDLAQSVFQVHAVDSDGNVVVRRTLRRAQVLAVLQADAALPGRDGSVRDVALLGAGAEQIRP